VAGEVTYFGRGRLVVPLIKTKLVQILYWILLVQLVLVYHGI